MSFIENPARRSFLKAAAGSAVFASTQLAAPAVQAFMKPWRKTPDYDADVMVGLLMDFSASVEPMQNGINEVGLQINGTAEAFEHPAVIAAIKEQPRGVAVSTVHFASFQKEILPWRMIRNEKDSRAFAQDIRDAGVNRIGLGAGTNITPALAFMQASIAKSPLQAWRKVVDISGDGIDNTSEKEMNMGMSYMVPDQVTRVAAGLDMAARLHATVMNLAGDGVTVNGISICNETADLDLYYQANVVTPENVYIKDERGMKMPVSPGFVVRANGHEDYAKALVRKLVREIG